MHVGLQVRSDPVDLVPGDADSASWTLEVRVKVAEDGALDFAGPAVHGRRGERFLYLTWGDVGSDGGFAMFRRAKLMLDRVDPALVRSAEDDGQPLIGEIIAFLGERGFALSGVFGVNYDASGRCLGAALRGPADRDRGGARRARGDRVLPR